MHKVEELESRWFNYKVKQIISPAIKVSSLYLLLAGSYYVYSNKSDMLMFLTPSRGMTNVLGVSIEVNNSIIEKTTIVKNEAVENKEEIIKKEEVSAVPKIIEKIALIPIVPVIDMEKEERIPETKRVKSVKRVKSTNRTKTVRAKKNAYLTAKELDVIGKSKQRIEVVPRKTKKMNFTSTSSNYLETMKNKFSKSNSPRDALLVAKTYYKNAEYSKSEKWALSANKLDNSLEDSWLFFAKSKAKLGKKKEALKILVSYYKKSQSKKAKRLIGQIQTGRI
ncbi:MAG TPA: hypothetical protein EYG94_04720 [Campylobacterales bacterium]|nr:hypothetical protein [Campylobacterales bacterium]